ncbi:MAG: cell surface protein SprA, partial [Bacteroidota bacterium]|nr:cell surface protein SprA [Bacteroidota bacterium]
VLQPGTLPTTDGIAPIIQKSFYISRIYDLKWDLTKSLIFDYTANNRGVIDEGVGRTIGSSPEAIDNRSQLQKNFLQGGRTINFTQTAALTYRLPLDKFPLTDWLSADTRYAANYIWQAASLGQTVLANPLDPSSTDTRPINLGNTIQNNRELSANGKVDLVKLYNKVKFLNVINNAPPPADRGRSTAARLLNPEDPANASRKPVAAPADTAKEQYRFVKAVLRGLMTARSVNFTYQRNEGTLLPGYLPKTSLFGFDNGFTAPGLPFIAGKQYDLNDLYELAASRGWYTNESQYLNTALSNLLTENLTVRTALEPIRGFNIQVDARRQLARNQQVYYRRLVNDTTLVVSTEVDPLTNRFLLAAHPLLGSGSFQTSTITIQTLFGDLGANGETSKAFEQFVKNRGIVRDELAKVNPSTAGIGYSYNSQDVLIQSFTDAYHGRSSDGYQAKKFSPFAMLPLPNWRVDYNGFADLPLVKRYFSSFTLNHAYRSDFQIGSYNTATIYDTEPDFPTKLTQNNLFIPYYIVGQVNIIESLSPLIGVNFQTVSRATGRLEYRTDRRLTLNVTNAQVTEFYTKEIVIGLGYATNSLKLPFRIGGEQRVLKNNLTARLDLSIRDNITVQRSIENVVDPNNDPTTPASVGIARSTITNGNRTFQLRPTIDYLLNTRLNLQLYFSQNITTPRISNAFRNTATEGGLQLRYSLTQ